MPKNEPEIIPPVKPERAYNRRGISMKDFLHEIVWDESLPMQIRMEAATKVSVYDHPRLAQVNQDLTAGVTIRIEGGLPALPGTDVIMPDTEPK